MNQLNALSNRVEYYDKHQKNAEIREKTNTADKEVDYNVHLKIVYLIMQ
jgi:hypothetical protein